MDQKEIEDAFSDQRGNAYDSGKSVAENIIKVTGPVKKQYFTPEESKSIQMSVNKLPRPDVLKEALIHYDESLVTEDQILNIIRVWPKQSPIEDLEKE